MRLRADIPMECASPFFCCSIEYTAAPPPPERLTTTALTSISRCSCRIFWITRAVRSAARRRSDQDLDIFYGLPHGLGQRFGARNWPCQGHDCKTDLRHFFIFPAHASPPHISGISPSCPFWSRPTPLQQTPLSDPVPPSARISSLIIFQSPLPARDRL